MKLLRMTGCSIALITIFYGVGGFVAADFRWINYVWSWTRGERAALAYGVLVCVMVGSMCGAWLFEDQT